MNQLQNRDAFAAALQNYRPSAEAQKLLAELRLVLLVGPSSSGRNTIINELLKSGKYHYIISDTTRQPRVNNGVLEQNGREYWFRQESELLSELQAGEFLEAAIIHEQQVSGISIRELAAAAREGLIAINEIENNGADAIHAVKPDALFLFIIPPSFDEWMARMNLRGELPADEVRRRVSSALSEINTALARDYYTFVVNDTFKQTAAQVASIITGGQAQAGQALPREIARRLVTDIQAYLA